MRGSRRGIAIQTADEGIIPAGAGLTSTIITASNSRKDHPRGCGAHVEVVDKKKADEGSSPRVRGSLDGTGCRPRIAGIIPAGAGLTLHVSVLAISSRDHPRGCGAHMPFRHYAESCLGSSPRVRGSQCDVAAHVGTLGIIPAGAGLTNPVLCLLGLPRDHPRGCGAHIQFNQYLKASLGSSPRVRGSLVEKYGFSLSTGIIPAGAGLTLPNSTAPQQIGDHPRGCGAHAGSSAKPKSKPGSSPRVRGSPSWTGCATPRSGIIPAGAGLTYAYNPPASGIRDHPRGCGAHCASGRAWNANLGSSPRVRGSP